VTVVPRGDGDSAGVLIRRAIARADRPLITWKDPAVVLWLACGVVIAPMPRAFRSSVCRLAAGLAARTRRARQARERMMQMLKLSERDAGRMVRELQAGRLAGYLDVVRGLMLKPDFRVSCRGLAHIAEAQSQGHGAILWISDFVSAGDVSKVALAREGLRMSHLSRPEHGFTTSKFGMRFLNPLRIRFECGYLAERVVFDRGNPAPAMSHIEQVVRRNGVVSIMASMHEGGTLADVPFLTGRLKLSLGAVRLALLSDAPVIPVFVVRDRAGNGAFEVIVAAPLKIGEGPREKRLLGAVCEYAGALEAFVRDRPACWVGWRRAGQLSTRA
jgi:lauroyl/myristoyl acyltransferase